MGRKAKYDKKRKEVCQMSLFISKLHIWLNLVRGWLSSEWHFSVYVFLSNICFHIKLVQYISQKKILISGRPTNTFWDLKI